MGIKWFNKKVKYILLLLILALLVLSIGPILLISYGHMSEAPRMDTIKKFISGLEDEARYRVILLHQSSNITSKLPLKLEIYFYFRKKINRYFYLTNKSLASYSYSLMNKDNSEFYIIVDTFNDRLLSVELKYSDCSLKMEMEEFKNRFITDTPDIESILTINHPSCD